MAWAASDPNVTDLMRLLAVDVRPRRMGYAVFETPTQLLEWGVRRLYSGHETASRIGGLLEMFQPSVVVLRKITVGGRRDTPRTRENIHSLRGEAARRSIPLAFLTEQTLVGFFRSFGTPTKHEVATAIAARLPELAWKLPPPRKPWQPEHWRATMFDAVALGVVHLGWNLGAEATRGLPSGIGSFRRPLSGAAS